MQDDSQLYEAGMQALKVYRADLPPLGPRSPSASFKILAWLEAF